MQGKVEITRDLFAIAKRLKAIDYNYKVFYNYDKGCYEVYSLNNFCFKIGNKLNNIAINKAFNTHIRNKNKIFAMIDKNNKKLKDREEKSLIDLAKYQLKTRLEFANKSSRDVSFSDVDKTKWF